MLLNLFRTLDPISYKWCTHKSWRNGQPQQISFHKYYNILRIMIVGKKTNVKLAPIRQATRVLIVPRQLGLGLQMHHQYSWWVLIDTLNSLGISCSYSYVKISVAVTQGTQLLLHIRQQIQYVADNFDHNICTVDGAGTIQGLGLQPSKNKSFNEMQAWP